MNCSVTPSATLGLAGVTAIDTSVAAVTVSVSAGDTMAPRVAVILVVPAVSVLAKPALLMVATAGVPEAQVTADVKSAVLLSWKVPVALNCCGEPAATLGFTGVTAIDTRGTALTVIANAGEVCPPNAAVMFAFPAATAVTSPALFTVATEGVSESHVACVVTFCVVLSVKVAVAVICSVWCCTSVWLVAVTATEVTVAAVTMTVVFPETPMLVAVMIVLPSATDVATPAALTVAVAGVAEDQLAELVRS